MTAARERIRRQREAPARAGAVDAGGIDGHTSRPELACGAEQALEVGAEVLCRMQRGDDQLLRIARRVLHRQALQRLARTDLDERERLADQLADAVM